MIIEKADKIMMVLEGVNISSFNVSLALFLIQFWYLPLERLGGK